MELFAGLRLREVILGDLQAWATRLAEEGRASASQGRIIAAVKSPFAFGHQIGYLPFDTAAPLRSPRLKDKLAERILPEHDVQRLMALEPNRRNRAMLRLLYASGMLVSELVGLTWADCVERGENGTQSQVAAFGKGGKTRFILLPASVWLISSACVPADGGLTRLFSAPEKGGGALDPSQALRIVRAAARRAGIELNVSPHWMRHAHASHSLDRGAPVSLVQATLGHSRTLRARPAERIQREVPGRLGHPFRCAYNGRTNGTMTV